MKRRTINLDRFCVASSTTDGNGYRWSYRLETDPKEWDNRADAIAHLEKLIAEGKAIRGTHHVSEYRIDLKDAVTCTTPLEYLQRDEWEMGNGQCFECEGLEPDWGDSAWEFGHKLTCQKAKAIEALGGKVVWLQENPAYKESPIFKELGERMNAFMRDEITKLLIEELKNKS